MNRCFPERKEKQRGFYGVESSVGKSRVQRQCGEFEERKETQVRGAQGQGNLGGHEKEPQQNGQWSICICWTCPISWSGRSVVLGGSQRPVQEIQGLVHPGLPWATSVSKESCLLPSDSHSPVVSMVATNNQA